MNLRLATEADAAAIQAIYAPVVERSHTSFETEPPSVEEMRSRILSGAPFYPWLAADLEGAVRGYCYASKHRDRPCYRWSVEVSVYVDAAYRGQGVGKALYGSLFELLRAQGYQTAYAGITLPNPASIRLHESIGFTPVGVYHKAGYKLGAWHDVGWWEVSLGGWPLPPSEPLPVTEAVSRTPGLLPNP